MKLKELRISKGATQKEIANAIGCSVPVYSRYENGRREADLFMLEALADYFEVSIDYFIGRKNLLKGGKKLMSKGGHGVSGHTHSQSQLDNYANQNNPNNDAYWANQDNHSKSV